MTPDPLPAFPEPTDADLLQAFASARAEPAFRTLVARHLSLVYHSALQRTGGRPELAQDVTQVVFSTLAHRASSLTRHPCLTGWLFTTTRYAASRAMRDERRRLGRETEAYHMNDALASSPPEWAQLRPALLQVMDALSARDREAILRRFFDQQTYPDLARAWSLSEDAARKRTDRAVDRLRSLLARRGITSTSTALAALLAAQGVLAAPTGLLQTVTVASLGSTAAVALPASLLLQFMTTKSIVGLGVILGVAGLIGLGTAAYEMHADHTALAALAAAQQSLASDQSQARALDHQAQIAEAKATRDQAELDHLRAIATTTAQKAAAAKVRPAPTSPASLHANATAFMAAFSQVRPMLLSIGEAQTQRTFADFFRQAGLTPDQIERFKAATAELWAENMAVTPAGSFYPLQGKLPDDQVEAIIGASAMDAYHEYVRAAPAHGFASALSARVSYLAEPFSAEQEDQVANTVASNSPSYVAGGPVITRQVNWPEAYAQLSPILSPTQLTAAEPTFKLAAFQQALLQARAASVKSN